MKKHFTFILILFIYSLLTPLHAQQLEDVVTGLDNPFGLAFHENELYISSQNVPGASTFAGKIVKIDPFAMNPVPVEVAEYSLSTSMVVYNDFLYVTNFNSIARIDLSATMPTPEVVLANLGFPNGLLVIEDELFFCQTALGSINKIDLTQSNPTPVTVVAAGQGLTGPIALAHSDGTLYVAESDDSEISTIDLSAGNPSPTPFVDEQMGVLDIHLDGDYLYAAVIDGITRFNINESNPGVETVIAVTAPHGLTFIDGNLHVSQPSTGKVLRVVNITPLWSSLADVCASEENVILGGASPSGGVYSGDGVTDNGDGTTFTFDPAAAGGAGTYMLTYTVDGASVQSSIEVVAGPMVSFMAPGPFEPDAGLQALTSGMPAGGVYTGTGVVDNGDGTYSFDPSIGEGTYTITYTLTDGNGCSSSAMGDILVEVCELPVINGVNIVSCNNNILTLEVDGVLNDAAQWEWGLPSSNGEPCEDQFTLATGSQLPGTMFSEPDWTYYVRAVGGCLDEPVCFAYVPSDLIGETASFTLANTFYCSNDGIQTGLTGGAPAGGIYSGTGVIDDGNGMTFSFDPNIGGGNYTITYTANDVCSSVAEVMIEIEDIGGGTVALSDGSTEVSVCGSDGIADELIFASMNAEGESFTYLVTTQDNIIISFSETGVIDFENAAFGTFRVWGLSYTGNLTVFVGDNAATTTLSDECYDLSDNFVTVSVFEIPVVTFTPPGPFESNAGLQALTGGSPAGGTYTGMGVIDNGDGTYSFDPSIGAGTYDITYSFTNPDGCSNSAMGSIVVETSLQPGDICTDAFDINTQFGQGPDVTTSSGPYDNTDASTDESDPDFGWECFGEPDGGGTAPSLERTLWFTFTGDGGNYFIEALACGDDPIDFGDTQFAIYSGSDCDNLEAVLCSEDGPNAMSGGPFPAGDTLQTEAGVTYYMMVDGFGPDFAADGEFCVEVTQVPDPVELTAVTFQVDASILVADGELAPEGMIIAGSFNNFQNLPMTEGANNVWSFTLEVPQDATYEYKFKNGVEGWENIDTSIGDDCTVGGYGNRAVEVGDMDMTLDVVCFAYCVTCVMVDVDEAALEAGINVFPNPANDILNVQIDLQEAAQQLNIRLVNAFGQIVSEQYLGQLQSDMIEIDLNKVPAGAYMLQVLDGRSQFIQSVIVQK
jgi:hypothetical protein